MEISSGSLTLFPFISYHCRHTPNDKETRVKVRRAVAGAVFAAGLGAGTLAGSGVAQATPPTPTPLLAQLLQHQGNGHEANHPGKVVAGLATGDLEASLVQSWKTPVEAPVVTAIDDWNAGTANADLLYCDDWNPGNSENWLGAEDCSTGGGGAGLSLLPGGVPGPTPDPGPTDPGPTNPGPTPDPGPGPGNGGDNGNGSHGNGSGNGDGNGSGNGGATAAAQRRGSRQRPRQRRRRPR